MCPSNRLKSYELVCVEGTIVYLEHVIIINYAVGLGRRSAAILYLGTSYLKDICNDAHARDELDKDSYFVNEHEHS